MLADMVHSELAAWWMLLVMAFFWGLILCLAGYMLYRMYIVLGGLQAGIALGALAVGQFFHEPGGADYFIVCSCLGILLALGAWVLDRLVFAVMVLALVGWLAWVLVAGGVDTWVGVVLGFAGLIAAVLTFRHLKPIFIFVSSLVGSATAVASGAALLTDRTLADWPVSTTGAAAAPLGLLILLAVLTIALTATGMIVQYKFSRYVRSRLLPDSERGRTR